MLGHKSDLQMQCRKHIQNWSKLCWFQMCVFSLNTVWMSQFLVPPTTNHPTFYNICHILHRNWHEIYYRNYYTNRKLTDIWTQMKELQLQWPLWLIIFQHSCGYPQVHIFECLVPSWWNSLGRIRSMAFFFFFRKCVTGGSLWGFKIPGHSQLVLSASYLRINRVLSYCPVPCLPDCCHPHWNDCHRL